MLSWRYKPISPSSHHKLLWMVVIASWPKRLWVVWWGSENEAFVLLAVEGDWWGRMVIGWTSSSCCTLPLHLHKRYEGGWGSRGAAWCKLACDGSQLWLSQNLPPHIHLPSSSNITLHQTQTSSCPSPSWRRRLTIRSSLSLWKDRRAISFFERGEPYIPSFGEEGQGDNFPHTLVGCSHQHR